MDKDSIYRTFQEICRQIPVIILGSGPSCSAGIPGMKDLAEHLLKKLHNNTSVEWNKIRCDLKKTDLETALSNNPPSESLNNESIQIVEI